MSPHEPHQIDLSAQSVARIDASIRRACRRLLRDSDAFEDACQNAWVKLLEKQAQCRDPDNPAAFAATLARNQTITDLVRARDERDSLASSGGEDFANEVEPEPVLRQQIEDEVGSLPLQLPQQRRLALILWMEGRSTRQIAAALHVAEGTAKATVHQALRQVKEVAARVLEKYRWRDEPDAREWEPPMRVMQRHEMEECIAELEQKHGAISDAERESLLAAPEKASSAPARGKGRKNKTRNVKGSSRKRARGETD